MGGEVLRISSDGDDQNLGAGKTKTQNNPQGFQQNPHKTWTININPKIPMLMVIPKPQFGFTFLPNYGAEKGTTTNLLQKNRYLNKIKPPKKNLANFPTQKNPRMENFKPKKIL